MSEQQYQVLAIKYRPKNFSELKGHKAMVQTLSNAILSNKLAHAFILTGIRGIGKTTTARIIAKVINCQNQQICQDEDGHEIVEACGHCDSCRAIAEARHQDVLELDAASHTGVDDIREIIDTVNYLPVSAKYKVYIIDEVHMLSKNAFNALLKTLEEPPAHVKFIFATTEIQKVPITVLSRCQRFDLKRLTHQDVVEHLAHILEQEGKRADPEVLSLIATASEGSARDSLSLLDQAISLGNYQDKIDFQTVAEMLGVIDRLKVYELFANILKGQTAEALATINDFYRLSIDVKRLLQDLLSLTHKITLAKTAPQYLASSGLIDSEKQKITEIADQINLPSLVRIWQALFNGSKDVNYSTNQKEALEMLIIKICYLSTLPTPTEIIRQHNANSAPHSIPTNQAAPATSNHETSLMEQSASANQSAQQILEPNNPLPANAPYSDAPLSVQDAAVQMYVQELDSQMSPQNANLIALQETRQETLTDNTLSVPQSTLSTTSTADTTADISTQQHLSLEQELLQKFAGSEIIS